MRKTELAAADRRALILRFHSLLSSLNFKFNVSFTFVGIDKRSNGRQQ